MEITEKMKLKRSFLRSDFGKEEGMMSDQELLMPQPPLEKPYDLNSETIALPEVNSKVLNGKNLIDIFTDRKSNRSFSKENISLEELSFLLWSTQGVKEIKGDNYATIRPVPSAGARHPFETYIAVNRVEGLKSGVYRYLALSHQLLFMFGVENLEKKLTEVTLGQKFVGKSAVTFIWSVIPYRGEWRYSLSSHKVMLVDVGHVCQNLYIACEAIGCGTCAIGAYDQNKIDEFLSLDGSNEFVLYVSPVGKV